MPQVLTLPLPPSANAYWKMKVGRSKAGKPYPQVYTTKQASAYKKKVKKLLAGVTPSPAPFVVFVKVFRDERRGDLDNFNKVLYDSLEGIVWENDKQIVMNGGVIAYDKLDPRVELMLWELDPRAFDDNEMTPVFSQWVFEVNRQLLIQRLIDPAPSE